MHRLDRPVGVAPINRFTGWRIDRGTSVMPGIALVSEPIEVIGRERSWTMSCRLGQFFTKRTQFSPSQSGVRDQRRGAVQARRDHRHRKNGAPLSRQGSAEVHPAQPCFVGGRRPGDPHHARFAVVRCLPAGHQPRAVAIILGKVDQKPTITHAAGQSGGGADRRPHTTHGCLNTNLRWSLSRRLSSRGDASRAYRRR